MSGLRVRSLNVIALPAGCGEAGKRPNVATPTPYGVAPWLRFHSWSLRLL